jgi:hypothetical protein
MSGSSSPRRNEPATGSDGGIEVPTAGTIVAASPAASALALHTFEAGPAGLHSQIEGLKKAQAEARVAKAKATKELRNAVKKKTRVMKKARELSNTDLAEVITMRQEAAAQKAARSGPSENTAKSSAGSPARPRQRREIEADV